MEQERKQRAQLEVENVGGIERISVGLSPGVTVLAGRNATNRTSLLRSIMAAYGSERASLRAGAEEGRVELSVEGTTVTRTLSRQNGSVVFGGEPLREDSTVADLFAFLLESNEARRAVVRNDDLREVLMRPVDTESIRETIERLQSEKRELEAELDELDELKESLPELEDRRRELESRIEAKREELAETEAAIEQTDASVSENRETRSELEATLDELRETRSDLEDVRFKIETHRESLDDLRDERGDLEEELSAMSESPEEELAEIEDQLDRLRDRKGALDAEITQLQSVVQFNQEMLEDEGRIDVLDALTDDGDGALTDRLVEDDSIVCWTCGNEVGRESVEGTLERLRELRRTKVSEVEDVDEEIEALRSTRSDLQNQQRQRERIQRKIRDIEDEIDRREGAISDLEERRDELATEIERLESTVDELEGEIEEELVDRHREANDLEFELGSLENDLERVEEEIAEIEDRLQEYDEIERQLEEVRDELTDSRTRIEQLERDAVSQFNDHMERVLDLLEYDNVDRVWLERIEQEGTDDRRFELHVVRSVDGGVTYEDTVEHLSESEREVVGLIFALAGYLVHDVHEECPFMLLDSLESLDSARIASLIDYMRNYAEYLVVALLPEDAEAVDDEYERVTDIS